MKKLFSILVFLFIVLIFISGCGPSSITVSTRPVAPVYARPAAPGVGYVWVQGEWVRRGHGYIYREGLLGCATCKISSIYPWSLAKKKTWMVLGSRKLDKKVQA